MILMMFTEAISNEEDMLSSLKKMKSMKDLVLGNYLQAQSVLRSRLWS